MIRFIPFLIVIATFGLSLWGAQSQPWLYGISGLTSIAILIGLYDLFQSQHTLLRNFPLLGRVRWLAEMLRPFFRAYIVESETEGRPFNHEQRAMVYRRAKNVSSVEPFGSHLDIEAPPYEWLAHSITAKHPETTDPRILVGAPGTPKPYSASVLNISAMSFGSLGARAIEALRKAVSFTIAAKVASRGIIKRAAGTWSGSWALAILAAAPKMAALIQSSSKTPRNSIRSK